MAKNVGQKRQAAQASIDSEEDFRRTRSKVTSEELGIVTGNKRATRSSDQSNANPSSFPTGNGDGTPPAKKRSTKESKPAEVPSIPKKKIVKKGIAQKVVTPKKFANPKFPKYGSKSLPKAEATANDTRRQSSSSQSEMVIPVRTKDKVTAKDEASEDDESDEPSYWLMKAEPESRIEKGKDVKFSIEDLENATEPEAWDGVRNAVARNNMRAMMTGDMAFFYHSNCKKPGIVGTMEIVREHTVDETAFDSEHPYYDEKSTREKAKWCVVHVELRRKFPNIVSLKELQRYAKLDGVLENMQTLKMLRLSVSKVTKKEWDFINSLVDADGDTATTAN